MKEQFTIQLSGRFRELTILGDPTLRATYLLPPPGLSGSYAGTDVTLNWGAVGGASFNVYQSSNVYGPFTRVASGLTGTGAYN